MLVEIDLDSIADDVYFALDSVDVQDCWGRAGGSRDGYNSPDCADATLVAPGEELGTNRVFTLDVRGFSAYRLDGRKAFKLAP